MRPDALVAGLSRYRRLLILSGVTLLLDQLTKYWIHEHSGFPLGAYPPEGGIEVIPGFFSLVFNINTGAAWGLFSNYGGVLALLAVAVLVSIVAFRRSLELHRPFLQISFGLIVGGIIGNLIDRLRFRYVIDFLDVHLGFYRWPTFNIADSGIVIGVGLYLYWSFVLEPRIRKTEPSPEASGT